MFIKDDEIVYSTCAKVGNKCNDEQILDGQIVNGSVNNTTNLDFYAINMITSNIHEKNYLVSVIEIPKTLINE